MSYLMLSLFIVVGLLTILGLINPAWGRFVRLETRKSIFGVGIGSLALLTIIHFLYYFLLSIAVIVALLMYLGLIKPAWVQFTGIKTRGAILASGIIIAGLLMIISIPFTPEHIEQEIAAKKAKEEAQKLARQQERIERARRDSIRKVQEKARKDSIALVKAAIEKARKDSIALEKVRAEKRRKEKARQDSIKWANRSIEEVVKAHAIHRYGRDDVKDVDVLRKGGPNTQAFVEYFSSILIKSMHKTKTFNDALTFFEDIYEDPACSDIDEVVIVVLVELKDIKGNVSIGPLVKIRFPRVKDVNYDNLTFQTDDIIRLIEHEGRIEWYVAGYR